MNLTDQNPPTKTSISKAFHKMHISTKKPSIPFTGFMVGPTDTTRKEPFKSVYIGEGFSEYGLLVYQFKEDLTVVVLVDKSEKVENHSVKFCDDLKKFFEQHLPPVYEEIVGEWNTVKELRY